MKYLVIVLLLAGGYWFYTEKYGKPESPGENLIAQLQAGQPVSMQQAKIKANEIVTFICNDANQQAELHSSTAECMGKYAERKATCEQNIFPDSAPSIRTEEELKDQLKRFLSCATNS